MFFLLLIMQPVFLFAQDIEVKKFEPLEKDQTAVSSPRKDINGNACSLVKVALKEPGAEFEGNVMGDVQFTGSEYLVYMPNGSKRLGIKHPDYLPTTIVFADYGTKKVASSTTYELKVKTNKKKAKVDNSKKGMAVFNIKPSNAMLLIDGQIADGSGGAYMLSLPYGTHYYTVKLKDFSINNQVVQIDKNAKTINVDLTDFFAKIDVTCETSEAEIKVNGEQKGVGRWSGTLAPGKYTIEVSKDGSHSESRQIELSDNEVSAVAFPKLKTITGSLRVDYEPAGADVWLNGKKVGITPLGLEELPVGNYIVEVKKEYYVNKTFTVAIEEDSHIIEKGELGKTEFGRLYYHYNKEKNMNKYPDELIDYYRLGVYHGYRGALAYCVRDPFKIPLNPVRAVKLLKDYNSKKQHDSEQYVEYTNYKTLIKYCGSLMEDNATIAYNLAVATVNHWDELGVSWVPDNYRFVPLAWHYFYGIGCEKNVDKARALMKQACENFIVLYDNDEQELDEDKLPSGLRALKEGYSTHIVADNAYSFPAWYKLVEDMGLSNLLLFVPEYLKNGAPEIFESVFYEDIMF